MAVTTFRSITTMEVGQAAKEANVNAAYDNLSRGISGAVTLTVTTLDITLTAVDENDEARNLHLFLSGASTGARNIIVPTLIGLTYIVTNNTTGGFSHTVKTVAGTGIAVAPGMVAIVFCDGTNVREAVNSGGAWSVELSQDAIGAMVDTTLIYVDGTPLLTRGALTGDVTAPQASNTTTIAAGVVTHAKYQDIATDRLLGRDTASSGDVEELTVGGGIEFSGSGGIQVVAASDTVAGKVELATAAETTTGTDATRAVTPDGLAGSAFGTPAIGMLVSDPLGSAITTGDGKAYVRIPSTLNGMNLVGVAASVSTVSSSGIPTVQLRRVRAGTPADMLSTKLTIDASELDSSTAAAAAVIDAGNDDVATADQIHIDIDVSGTGAKGLFIEMQFRLP